MRISGRQDLNLRIPAPKAGGMGQTILLPVKVLKEYGSREWTCTTSPSRTPGYEPGHHAVGIPCIMNSFII